MIGSTGIVFCHSIIENISLPPCGGLNSLTTVKPKTYMEFSRLDISRATTVSTLYLFFKWVCLFSMPKNYILRIRWGIERRQSIQIRPACESPVQRCDGTSEYTRYQQKAHTMAIPNIYGTGSNVHYEGAIPVIRYSCSFLRGPWMAWIERLSTNTSRFAAQSSWFSTSMEFHGRSQAKKHVSKQSWYSFSKLVLGWLG